jgi:HSP20 family protein
MFSLVPTRNPRRGSTYYHRSLEPFGLLSNLAGWGHTELADWFSPALDTKETKEGYVFSLDLPGVEQQDVNISVEGGVLSITGRREREDSNEGERYCACERSFGSFSRRFTLPQSADSENVVADLKNGVLTVTVSKKPESQPKQIAVNAS